MIIVSGSTHVQLAHQVSLELGVPMLSSSCYKFNNQELFVSLDGHENLMGQEVLLVQSICHNIHDELIELLMLADAVRRAGAVRIIALIPFLPYMRQDKQKEGAAFSPYLLTKLFESVGVHALITVDIHKPQLLDILALKIYQTEARSLFVPIIRRYSPEKTIIVAPDAGGFDRAQAYSNLLQLPLVAMHKKRWAHGGCEIIGFSGDLSGKHALIIDDIVDTGETLKQVTSQLIKHGAVTVDAFVTHALLTPTIFQALRAAGLRYLYTTDSCHISWTDDYLRQLSIKELVLQAIKTISR